MPGVTSVDVARASGVSRTTVSYVLNGTPGVTISEATRQRVLEAAQRLGYAPSAAARALRRGRTDLVLCVLPNWPIGPVLDLMLDHLATALAERGLSVLVHHGRGPRPLSELWRAVTPRAVVGFAAFAPDEERAMRQAGIQVVSTMVEPDNPRAFAADQANIGRLQVDHLVERGHRVVGHAAPVDPRLVDFAGPRVEGVRAACAAAGLAAPVVADVELTVASATEAVRRWQAAGVTAVAAYNDEVALAVLAGVRAAGLTCPDDIAVIGVDDLPLAALANPALTTVGQPVGVQADYLAAAVLATLDGAAEPPPHPSEGLRVVVRAST
ncbi:LacI family DNA-binding transcriptional regulator [Actinotalea solisilvae]|uniref:LacI family DNA-binding transcriptional regulator n=1 Tax=Actinotalea solisilvae TaxID=2072922 RepID=UPI0018F1CB3E|nr:LacI family DNA-binding transcriptional regulator [Actinotalea solisilvae]